MKTGRLAVTAMVALSAIWAPAHAGKVVEPPRMETTVTAEEAADRGETAGGRADVRVARGEHGLDVVGRQPVQASRAAAWQVLTDYEAIARFVSSMQESRVSGRNGGEVLVDQVAIGRLMFFKRRLHVTLRVHEEPPGLIRFEDVQRKDFASYRGEWRIEERGAGVEIVYRVSARPAFAVPGMVARGMLQRSVRELLAEVAAEIARREALAGLSAAEPGTNESEARDEVAATTR